MSPPENGLWMRVLTTAPGSSPLHRRSPRILPPRPDGDLEEAAIQRGFLGRQPGDSALSALRVGSTGAGGPAVSSPLSWPRSP